MNAVVLIPTIDPDERLISVLSDLREHGFSRFVVVDDGSSNECNPLFEEIEHGGVTVLHHAVNLGKGAALKTGFAAIRKIYPDATHVVTADDDGQHLADDVANVCRAADGHHDHVVIGMRDLHEAGVPLRSRIGNAFSSAYFKLDTGVACPDTQTGLRAIPVSLIPLALSIPGSRYDYEMNFLTAAAKRDIPMAMVPISTVYVDNNSASHFSVVRDSALIYKQLLRFASSSLTCSAVDLGIFALLTTFLNAQTALLVAFATIFARFCSGALNFTLNRSWSFAETGSRRGNVKSQAPRYAALFFAQMFASMTLVTALSFLPIPLVGVKVLVDGTLFLVSYFVQRNWVFKAPVRNQPIIVKGGAAHVNDASTKTYPAL